VCASESRRLYRPTAHVLKQGKRFFFEKKKQKTFALAGVYEAAPEPTITKSFLLLFFKKEALPFL